MTTRKRRPEPKTITLVESTEKALAAAAHLTDMDVAATDLLLAIARKIDAWDRIVAWALEDVAESGGRPAVPANDNVSMPTYLKLCEQLGLTPAGRKSLDLKEVRGGGKLTSLRALRSGEGSKQPTAKRAASPGVRVRAAKTVHPAVAKADTAD